MLQTLVALLAAVAIAVPVSRRLGLGSVLGYLVGGLAIGPHGLRFIADTDQIQDIADLGVVMLLFLIGLELRPQRLWVMRHAVFGLGTAQLLLTGAVLAGLARVAGIEWDTSIIIGGGFALSSTAITLPLLAERDLLKTRGGRDAFAVLLFQDLAFIPLVALIPLLGGEHLPSHVPWLDVGRAVLVVAAILLGGRFLMPFVFRAIGGTKTPELFTATALLLVVGAAYLASLGGLSLSLGAFMAGVLVSASEYRHELQADIEPFEGLLLGFFFLSVGMDTDLALAQSHPGMLAVAVIAVIVVKAAVLYGLARVAKRDHTNAMRFALSLPEGSEFSFVVFTTAVAADAMAQDTANFATLVVAASMAISPLLLAAGERWSKSRPQAKPVASNEPIISTSPKVIICGFGRVGQIVARVLRLRNITFTALEKDQNQLDMVRRFGMPVYFGDPSRAELLRAAGADTAKLLVVAIDNPEDAIQVVEMAQRNFPNLKVLARARNRRHVHLLMDAGIDGIVRETFYSSLKLAEMSLKALDIKPAEAKRAISLFAEHDERALIRTHAFYKDETQVLQSAKQAAEELANILAEDGVKEEGAPREIAKA